MVTAREILAACAAAGVELWADGATLRARGMGLPAELADLIATAKPALLAAVQGYGPLSWVCTAGHVNLGPTASWVARCNACGALR